MLKCISVEKLLQVTIEVSIWINIFFISWFTPFEIVWGLTYLLLILFIQEVTWQYDVPNSLAVGVEIGLHAAITLGAEII